MNHLAIVFLIITNILIAKEGGAVGNGGGFAICADKNYYSYDYLIAKNFGFSESDLPDTNDYFIQLQKIRDQLNRLNDPMGPSFEEFIFSIFKQKLNSKYQWLESDCLELMWEPGLELYLPSDCRKKIQAVYFFPVNEDFEIRYLYNSKLIGSISEKQNTQMQISFLLVHEWLWNFFERKDYLILANFNALLNSKKLDSITKEEYFSLRPKVL